MKIATEASLRNPEAVEKHKFREKEESKIRTIRNATLFSEENE